MGFFSSISSAINGFSWNKESEEKTEKIKDIKPENYKAYSEYTSSGHNRNERQKEEPKEPSLPEVKVPKDFLNKVVENRLSYEEKKKRMEQQKDSK